MVHSRIVAANGALLLLLLAVAAPSGVAAQEGLPRPERAPAPPVGTRLRVEHGQFGQRVETPGALVRWTTDSLTVSDDRGRPISWPLGLVARVDVSQGRARAHTYPGAIVGMLVGGALGALAGPALRFDASCFGPRCRSRDSAMRQGIVAGLGIGLVVGGTAGALVHGELWRPIAARPAAEP